MLHRILENQPLRCNGVRILSSGYRMDSDDSKSVNSDDAQSITSTLSRSVFDDDDSKSVTSTMSLARSKEKCPCCNKELQARAMFNHIRKMHPDYLKTMYRVWEPAQFDNLIKTSAPIPIDWDIIDDFEETVHKVLFGCLACDNTFTTEQNGKRHCNTVKCKTKHIEELKRIKKEEQQEKKQAEKKFSKERLRWIDRTPQQIYSCIQQQIVFNNKKWELVSAKVIEYLQIMNRKYNRTYDCDEYVFTPTSLPAFENNKVNMEKEERRIDRDENRLQCHYIDVLRLFWTEHQIVSDAEYDKLERCIRTYPDIKY